MAKNMYIVRRVVIQTHEALVEAASYDQACSLARGVASEASVWIDKGDSIEFTTRLEEGNIYYSGGS